MHICSCPTNSRQLGVWAQHVPTLRDLMGIHVPWLMKVKTVRSCKTTFNDAASMLLSNIFVFCMRALRWRNWGVCGLFSIGSVPWPSHDIRPMELWSGGCSLVWNCSKSTCRMIPSPSNAIRKDGSMHPRSNLSVSNPPHLPSGLKLNQTQPTHARYPTSPEPPGEATPCPNLCVAEQQQKLQQRQNALWCFRGFPFQTHWLKILKILREWLLPFQICDMWYELYDYNRFLQFGQPSSPPASHQFVINVGHAWLFMRLHFF